MIAGTDGEHVRVRAEVVLVLLGELHTAPAHQHTHTFTPTHPHTHTHTLGRLATPRHMDRNRGREGLVREQHTTRIKTKAREGCAGCPSVSEGCVPVDVVGEKGGQGGKGACLLMLWLMLMQLRSVCDASPNMVCLR